MKIIVQWMPDAVETILYDLDNNNFIVDADTYIYFYEEIFWKGIQEFLEKRYKLKFKEMKEVGGSKAVENMFYNQTLISKYWPKYNKVRDKFYLYNNSVYTYTFIGFMNVGHEIQIYKYDLSDLVKICNRLTKRTKREKIGFRHTGLLRMIFPTCGHVNRIGIEKKRMREKIEKSERKEIKKF